MRYPRSLFIITDDVRPLSRPPSIDRRDCYKNRVTYPEEPVREQLGAPRLGRSKSSTRELYASMPIQLKRHKRLRRDSDAVNDTHVPASDSDCARALVDRVWKQRRDIYQKISVLSPSHLRVVSSPSKPTVVRSHTAKVKIRSSVSSTDEVLCDSPTMATELRRVIKTLTLREKEDSTLVKLAGCCYTSCRSKINVLDEMISSVVRVTRLLENLTSYQIGVTDSMD
jgi:hypothetical protein